MERIQVIFEIFNNEGRTFSGPLDFLDTTPEFKNIVLSPDIDSPSDKLMPGKMTFRILVEKNVHVLGQAELRCVVDEATREAEKFVYFFSAAFDMKVFGFECKGYISKNVERGIKDLYPELFSGWRASAYGTITTDINAPSISEMKRKMSQKLDLSKLMLFFDSATTADPVARFISLYTVMLHLCEDKQKKVDEAILKIDPTVAESRRPKRNHFETIFTKFRNELSHPRDGVNILTIHNRIRNNVDRFERIVKTHILGEF